MAERNFAAQVAALPEVSAFLEEELERLDCPMKAAMQLQVAMEEIFVNIASYAYPTAPGEMTLSVTEQDGYAVLRFTDSGIPFDPLAKEDPDITLSAEDRRIGGLGIYMVKKSMDDVAYVRENGQNIFTMRKKM